MARFIEDRYFEKHINRMRTYYRKIRDELLDAIANSALATHCNIAEEDSGLHFLLHIDTSLPDLQKQKNMVFTYLFCPNIMKKEALIFRHIH